MYTVATLLVVIMMPSGFALEGTSGVELPTQSAKATPPDGATQQRTEKDVKTLFIKDFSLTGRDTRRALSEKLLAEANGTKDHNTRYTLFLMARDVAADSLQFKTAFAAIDKLDEEYELAKPPLTGANFSINLYALGSIAIQVSLGSANAGRNGVRLGSLSGT